ncbi:TldD/PmbA family protein [Sediminibacterium soli]|uniref:TldD/PmbA family protein n=1 Tax=Sediminibacterium soli TaxID=2698829 RepID=UPI001379DD7A|nr:TldD/PmbA family protein [Sediminibacterium soli]NCI45217.1 TldD/PmbA family protein [Sediminibacterium soli]
MAILTKEEAKALLAKVMAFSKAEECEARLSGSEQGNIRYALNAVSTAGDVSTLSLFVSSTYGKKTASASINEFDDASLEKVVRRAEELARLAPDNPERMPALGPQDIKDNPAQFINSTAALTPEKRAEMVGQSIKAAKEAKLEAAGFLVNTSGFSAMMNSKGLYAYDKSTNVNFSVTTRNADGTGSGYAAKGFNDVNKMDTLAATKVAASKANGSVGAKAIEPGKYTVILEPLAAAYIMENMFGGFDARSADEGRNYMSKPGGANRLGEQLFDEKVNIYSDPFHPDLPGSTWTGEGQPVNKMHWVEKGVVKNLGYSRYWAQRKNVAAVPGPSNIIMDGTNASLEDLIKGTEKGILVSRFWYIRLVDAQSMLLTGLTRDGTYYIENGQIKYPIKNMRFNESPVIMLNNVDALGRQERTIGTESGRSLLIPAMRIRDFTFTSLSDAV